MRKLLFALFAALFLVGGVCYGQQAIIDHTERFYAKDTATNSSATDTVAYLSMYSTKYGLASNMTVLATFDDSVAVAVDYQLRNSVTGAISAFTNLNDTLIVAHTTGNDTAAVVGTLPVATLSGYDQIRFRADYVTGNGTTAGRYLRLYYLFRK